MKVMQSGIVSLAKAYVPLRFKVWLMARYRNYVFRIAMRRFVAAPRLIVDSRSDVLADLIYGWGNPGWSAQSEYLLACAKEAAIPGGEILECGSGLSTLVLAISASAANRSVTALEHNRYWAEHVNSMIKRYGIRNAKVIYAPISRYENFDWYGVPDEVTRKQFNLIVCDGPPADTRGGRYGLVPVMRANFQKKSKIYLDDGQRLDEQKTAKEWAIMLSASYRILGERKPYIIVESGV